MCLRKKTKKKEPRAGRYHCTKCGVVSKSKKKLCKPKKIKGD